MTSGPTARTADAATAPLLSVLIVNYNTWHVCAQAIASLRRHPPTRPDGSPMPYECVVVDNKSPYCPEDAVQLVRDELARLAAEQGDPRAGLLVMHHENGGYSKGMNVALAHARGRWLLVSNPDVLFQPGMLPALQRRLEADPRVGITVPKGYWDPERAGRLPPNTLPTLGEVFWHALAAFVPAVGHWYGARLARFWVRVWLAEQPIALSMMSGCMFLVERGFFESIGRFDERFPLYYEDTDLSRTIRRAGRTIVQAPDAHLVHFVNRSGMTDLETMWQRHKTSRELYYRKWYGRLGLALVRGVDRLLAAKWTQRLRRFRHATPLVDLGASDQPPALDLGRDCERYLVLLSLDPRFFLAAGLFGSGRTWTPSAVGFAYFVHAVYYFQAFDLSGGRFERVGTWRYECRSHLGQKMPPKEPAP
jgi:N-acetylglucosaminyl-diphospho-decaprenol L-rhamnosyltransferase